MTDKDFDLFPSPCYIMEEELLRKNLELIKSVADRTGVEIILCSSHITFNSLAQFRRFYPMIQADGQGISCGIRVNPEYSEVETELYNPCAPGTRFGVMAEQLSDVLPQGIDGFHCHCHCESSSYELERTLEHLEAKFSSVRSNS